MSLRIASTASRLIASLVQIATSRLSRRLGWTPPLSLNRITGSPLAAASALLVGAGAVNGAGNLIFNLIVARQAGAAGYGAVGPLIAVATAAGLAANGTMYATARAAARSTAPSSSVYLGGLRSAAPYLLIPITMAGTAPFIAGFLHLRSALPVALTSLLVGAIIGASAGAGVLVGRCRYRVIAGVQLGTTLLRVALVVPLASTLGWVGGSLTASLVGQTVTLLVSMGFALSSRPLAKTTSPSAGAAKVAGSGRAALMAAALWGLLVLPGLIGRHLLSPVGAGQLAAGLTLGTAIVYFAGPVVSVFFSSAARHRGAPAARRGLTLTAALGAGAGLGMVLVGPGLVPLLFGSQYHLSLPLLVAVAGAGILVACVSYWCWLAVAQERFQNLALAWPLASLVSVVPLSMAVGANPAGLALAPALTLITTWGAWQIGSRMAWPFTGARSTGHLGRAGEVRPCPRYGPVPSLTFGIPSYGEGAGVVVTLDSINRAVAELRLNSVHYILSDSSVSLETSQAARVWAERTGVPLEIDYSPQRRSVKEALNVILERCTTELFVMVDADVLLPAESLARLLDHLMTPSGCDVAVGCHIPEPPHRGVSMAYRAGAWAATAVHRSASLMPMDAIRAGAFFGAWQRFYSEFRFAIGSESLAEDAELARRLRSSNWRVRNASDAVVVKLPPSTLRDFAMALRRTQAEGLVARRSIPQLKAAVIGAVEDPLGLACYLLARAYTAVRGRRLDPLVATEYWEPALSTKRTERQGQ